MLAMNKEQIAAAFDEDEVLNVPDLGNVQWPFLDYFGWVHSSGHLGFIVLQSPNDGQNRGIRMRREKRPPKKPRMDMCSWCHHVHRKSGTAMFTVSVRGSGGRHSLGNVVCKDLDCSLRVKNLVQSESLMRETLYQPAKAWRMRTTMHKWLGRANQL
jgi:hypothetical protein